MPIPIRCRRRPPGAVASALLLTLAGAVAAPAQTPTPIQPIRFTKVTNTWRSVTNFNVETIRGIALDDPAGRVWAINTHGSTLVYFTNTGGSNPVGVFPTINNPSALALYTHPGGAQDALVVGGGTHGVARHDRATGSMVGFLPLPSEPMDIVVDQGRARAYVSCGGAYDKVTPGTGTTPKRVESGGVVVEIDLSTFTELARHFIPSARPMFLSIDANLVYVAAHLSGNATTFTPIAPPGFEMAVVRRDEPDNDVFTIDHAGAVSTYIQNAGTLLTGHGRHPNGEYWVLGTESKNDQFTTEPAHRGRFADNRITIRNTAGVLRFASLDTVPAGGVKPASFPIALGFHPVGWAFITSSTSDVVRIVDANGTIIRNVTLPDGAIPRSIVVTPTVVWVYAWGRNEIYGYDVTAITVQGSNVPAVVLNLGNDPLPKAAKRGRQIWYDADRSRDDFASPPVVGKVSCNSCHPRGGMDLLGWRLEDGVTDRKDMMVTQSLLGIEDTFPYHWRGERALSDFNGAFPALLGGNPLSTAPDGKGSSELADFESFVFSLQGAANPREHLDRVIDDGSGLEFKPSGGAVFAGVPSQGQTTFHTATNALGPFMPASCVACHGPESGSNGNISPDVFTVLPTQFASDVPHLRQLAHKLLQPSGVARVGGVALFGDRPQGGFGLAQDGHDKSIIDFLDPAVFFLPVGGITPTVAAQQRIDTASFVAQFDEGIAPRAHRGIWFDLSKDLEMQTMISQASVGDIDLTVLAIAPTWTLSMWFDPATQQFHTMRPGQTGNFSVSYATLKGGYGPGLRLMFLGVPPGNGFRFGVDQDDDGLSGQLEVAIGTDPQNADSDGDGFPDGYERNVGGGIGPTVFNTPAQVVLADTSAPMILHSQIDHVSCRVAKVFVEFSEPVTYTVQVERLIAGVFTPEGPLQIHGSLRQQDTLVAHGLFPTLITPEQHRLVVTMRDLSGRTQTAILPNSAPNLVTRPAVFGGLDAFSTANLTVTPTTLAGTFALSVDVRNLSGSATGKNVLLQVLQWDNSQQKYVIAPAIAATLGRATNDVEFRPAGGLVQASWGTTGVNPTVPVVPGPFLLTGQITTGTATAVFSLPSATTPPGTRCKVIVLGVLTEVLNGSVPFVPPSFTPLDNRNWQMPMSPASGRSADFTR